LPEDNEQNDWITVCKDNKYFGRFWGIAEVQGEGSYWQVSVWDKGLIIGFIHADAIRKQ